MNLYGNLEDEKALAGMLYGMNPTTIVSYSALTDLEMGKGVFSVDGKLQNTGNENQFFGIACFTQIAGTTGKNFYKVGDTANIVTEGYVWAKIESGRNPLLNGSAYINTTTGEVTSSGTYAIGRFRSEVQNGLILVEVIPTATR